jgi:APA family basic amino acid/polyamine antiporter
VSEPARGGAHPRDRLARTLGLQDAVFLVVASVVGSGIFLTPGPIADRLPHPGLIFAVWVVGGLLSLAGALANAELGAMFPRAGGDYVYLREALHPVAGFLAGWLTFFAIYAGTVATLAAGFGDGLASFLSLPAGSGLPIALACIAACSALNWVGVRWGARANNLTGWAKLMALLAFGLLAPFTGVGDTANWQPLWRGAAEAASASAFALALSPVLFSYLGWNASVFVASELRDPEHVLPRSLFVGLAICAALYLLLNAVYLFALPVEELRHTANAGEAAARALFGGAGGRLVAAFVLVSILGTLNATVLVGPRIAYAMSLDGLLPGMDRVHADYRTPVAAIALQGLVAAGILLVLRTFPSALDFTTFAILLATIADTAALYALRLRRPGQPRPYRAWGYPVVPGLYLVANAAIAAGLAAGRPREALVGIAVLLAALPCYALLGRRAAAG